MSNTLLGFGLFLVAAAIVGGGMEAFGFKLPVIQSTPRQITRLLTEFGGSGMCLDVFNDGPNIDQPHLAPCENLSGQLWLLSRTDKRPN